MNFVKSFLTAMLLITQTVLAYSFDKPLQKRVLDLGRSEYLMRNDNRHVLVTCRYYHHFMVKQQDDPGLKGAGLIAFASVQPGRVPRCLQGLQAGEKQFGEWSEDHKAFLPWNGYFAGVKQDLIFLERPDGDENSGIEFAAFEVDAKTQFFTDSATLEAGGERRLNFIPASSHQIVLRYLRVASAGCSIPGTGESCWSKLRKQAGLAQTSMPRCTDYEGTEAGKVPSVIAYPVEATLYPKPTVRPLGAPVRCYPQQ